MLLFSFSSVLLFSCSGSSENASSVREVADAYYACLVQGDVDGYMQGIADYDSLPGNYRSQLRDMLLQHLDHERRLRGGIASATTLRDTLLDSLHTHVFVELHYGDSTREEVLLPMILTEKGWRMK